MEAPWNSFTDLMQDCPSIIAGSSAPECGIGFAGTFANFSACMAACAAAGHSPRLEGLSCWTDAALLSAAGIPALCFGPGDIALAHAAEEWVAVAEIAQATAILTELIGWWDRDAGDAWRR